jgi:hypothetical protein
MKKITRSGLLVALVCALALTLIPATPARAVGTLIYEDDMDIDPGASHEQGSYAFAHETTGGVDDSGYIWIDRNNVGGNYAIAVTMYFLNGIDFPVAPCLVNHIELDFWISTDTAGTEINAITVNLDNDGGAGDPSDPTGDNDYAYQFTTGQVLNEPEYPEDEWIHIALDMDNTIDDINSVSVRLFAALLDPPDPGTAVLESRMDNLQIYCDWQTDLIRPLAAEDERPNWELYDGLYANDLAANPIEEPFPAEPPLEVTAISRSVGDPVFSAAPGTVLVVERVDPPGFACRRVIITGDPCIILVPDEIHDEQNADYYYKLDLENAYYVVVSFGDDDELVYLVGDAPDYVEEGQEIEGGCIIGETLPLLNLIPFDISNIQLGGGPPEAELELTPDVANGITIVAWNDPGTDEYQRLYPRLTEYPNPEAPPCGLDPRLANCLGDADLTDVTAWDMNGLVTFNDPGFTLTNNLASLSTEMRLDEDEDYSMAITARLLSPANESSIRLTLGETVQTTTITADIGSLNSYLIPVDSHVADLGSFWTVSVELLGTTSIKVESICVTAAEYDPPVSPCYFVNNHFNYGVTGWTVSEGVIQRDGSIAVPSEGTFAQDIELPSDTPPDEFNLSVDVYIWLEPGATIDREDVTSTVALEYQIDSGDFEPLLGPASTETTTFSEFALASERQAGTVGIVTFSVVITIMDDLEGLLTIRPTVDTEVEGVLGVGIDSACIDGDFTNIGDEIAAGCQEPVRPQTELLSDWTVWHWRHLNRFFTCELMILLRAMYAVMLDGYHLMGWQGRYWMATGFVISSWMSHDLFPWLGGHFANMAHSSIINTEGGANFFDFLIALLQHVIGPIVDLIVGIIQQIADLLGTIINLILSLIVGFFTQVFSLLQYILGLFGVLINGISNATPTPPPGFPDCSGDPRISPICIVFWMLENTVFEPDTPGAFIIPVIVSLGTIMLILWAIAEIKNTIMRAGEAL